MIFMSVDYGDVRTGIALCDKGEILAFPVCVIEEKDRERLAEKIALLAAEKKAESIVVGLPQNMDGSFGFRCDECRALGELLAEKTGLPICYQNERLTTVSAHGILNQTNVRGKKRKQTVDKVAAVLILEDFLRARKASR